MNELNISAVDATAMETATTTSAPKHKWLSKLTRGAKKATPIGEENQHGGNLVRRLYRR